MSVRQAHPFALAAELGCVAGQLLALVGPSGSGKTSLLRMIAGLSRPQYGRIVCADDVWLDTANHRFLSPQQRRIGYVPQHYGLFPHMNALQNICAGLSHLPKSQQQHRASEWLRRMHLDGLQRHKPAELSGGQQQRVALARALAGNPSILLLDEPFSAVDSATREKLHDELAEIKQQLEIPIILVTHDLKEALMLADNMVLLNAGTTLQSGAPRDLMARPASAIAAGLVGIRNLFEGKVVAHDHTEKYTYIQFGAMQLASAYRPELAINEVVHWVIPDSGVRFRAISRKEPADNTPELNRCDAIVRKLLMLGDEVRLSMQVEGVTAPLQAIIPLRLARELQLCLGAHTRVRLRAEDIHLFEKHPDTHD